MYETQNFAAIMARMLSRVPDDVDKRQGSIIYDALAPAAYELAQMYTELDINLQQTSGQTATGEFLDRRTMDYNVNRRPATKAVQQGVFTGAFGAPFAVPIGSRFSVGGLTFIATEQIQAGHFELECTTAGTIGNTAYGTLLPIDYINGLATAQITELLIPGTDTETDDQLRARYLSTIRSPASSGNKADYKRWALEVTGVGDAAVTPLWAGPGTVKVTIIDGDKKPASQSLVDDVQAYIAPDNAGSGMAPVGATVTVTAAEGVTVNVTAAVALAGNFTLQQVQDEFSLAVDQYLRSIAFAPDPTVKYVRVGSILLDTPGVQDYSNLELNGGNGNVSVGPGEVAVMGAVTLS